MNIIDFTFLDESRARTIPVLVYLPMNTQMSIPVIIFSPGYQDQQELNVQMAHKNYEYLATFFTQKGYAFISIQHDISGDKDGLETLDYTLPQFAARKHLYVRGEENINFVLDQLEKKLPQLNLNKFIISGHSNGGDISKYFANNNPDKINDMILFDARRCPIKPNLNLRLLMFEAIDTSTDIGVIPDEGSEKNPKRTNLEWVIIKPKNAFHISYKDNYITGEIKTLVYSSIEWFLNLR